VSDEKTHDGKVIISLEVQRKEVIQQKRSLTWERR
jgi:hypothetical protein